MRGRPDGRQLWREDAIEERVATKDADVLWDEVVATILRLLDA